RVSGFWKLQILLEICPLISAALWSGSRYETILYWLPASSFLQVLEVAVKLLIFDGSSAMATVKVGLVGCGFVAQLHMYGYKRVCGVDAEVKAVAARSDHVVDFAKQHGIATTYRNFRDLIADQDIDVIDICTPPMLHATMIVE